MADKIIFHIDMNSFFASCEQVVNPELKGKPIVVVGDASRRAGIVLAASYEAKKYGIKTTMTIYQAQKCLPTVILVSSTYGLYVKMSKEVMRIFDDYTPNKEQLSIDEAFLDMTGTKHLFGEPIIAAGKIQKRILDELDLQCSVGISSNKLLAKMASDMKKPMGITTLFPNEVEKKMWPLSIRELYGVGRQTEQKLLDIGIRTIGDIALMKDEVLSQKFGAKYGETLKAAANGIGPNKLGERAYEKAKSIGNELTYSKDVDTEAKIANELLLIADIVGHRLRKHLLKGKTIQVKLKFSDFTVITRSITLDLYTDSTDRIYQVAKELVLHNWENRPMRLMGISLSNFGKNENIQISLFDEEEDNGSSEVDYMVDSIRNKYGYQAVKRGAILDKRHKKGESQ